MPLFEQELAQAPLCEKQAAGPECEQIRNVHELGPAHCPEVERAQELDGVGSPKRLTNPRACTSGSCADAPTTPSTYRPRAAAAR